MTLEEAIKHFKVAATENRRYALEFSRIKVYDSARIYQECAAEHEQLAEWLTELKQRREAEISEKPKTNGDRIRQMTDEDLAVFMVAQAIMGAMNVNGITDNEARKATIEIMESGNPNDDIAEAIEWLRKEVSEND